MTEDRSYEARCAYATTNQGLDPVVERLTAEGFPVEVEQTGGFCMVAVVTMGERVYCVTQDGGTYHLGVYTREGWHDTGDEALTMTEHADLDGIVAALDAGAAEAMVALIKRDMEAGIVPSEWVDFSELHSHVDANMQYVHEVLPLTEDGSDAYFDTCGRAIKAVEATFDAEQVTA